MHTFQIDFVAINIMELIYQRTSRREVRREVFLFCVFRDEYLLLEYFIAYYRKFGVTHFVMIDNLSSDAGADYLRTIPDINIRIYRSEDSYREADYGVQWINGVMKDLARDQYCLVADADELLVFDTRIYDSLDALIDSMESIGANVLPANLVDMYPRETDELYVRGADFLSHSTYFDEFNSDYYENRSTIYGGFSHKVGGVRKRVLDSTVCIHKFPFFRYDFFPADVAPGCHLFKENGQVLRVADKIRLHPSFAVLQHFKFIKPNFRQFVERRITNKQDWNDCSEYQKYLEALDVSGTLRLFDPRYSRRLESIEDLDSFFTWS
jgi:hypothetical protein